MVLKLLSLLLRYPDDEVVAAGGEIARAARELPPSGARERILRFLDGWLVTPPGEARSRYVETFDFRGKSCLYLTYFRFGDQRARGAALADLKELYAEAGYELRTSELPDYLPLVLEFAAARPDLGLPLIAGYRSGLEVVRKALAQSGSPYALLIEALLSLLPRPEERDLEEARRLVAHGPPRETVGLEPYGPEMPPARVAYGRQR